MADTEFEIIVFGATSFVGQLICRYLVETHGVNGDLKWAAAGRNERKLEALRDELGDTAQQLPLITADAGDCEQLRQLCERTTMVLSTVGPYALYGEPLIRACTDTGTDYADLTGEVHWIHRMWQQYEDRARETGARIVHCCGFDSLPSDLGVHFMQREADRQFGAPCERIKMRVRSMKGSFSGGTVASLLNVAQQAARDQELRKLLTNPYALCPEANRPSVTQPRVNAAAYDPDFDAWVAPFIMSAINTPVVHRSNCTAESGYSPQFQYNEAVLTGRGLKGRSRAYGMAAGLGAFMAGAALKPSRWLMQKTFLPAPGEGPSPQAQQQGSFDIRFHGRTSQGNELRTRVTGNRDPGYGATSRMISEAALCLARDTAQTEKTGGFWTPATLLGDNLIQRLTDNAGLTFEVL